MLTAGLCRHMASLAHNELARNTAVFVNPLRAKFFRGNLNIYLHFVSFLHIDATQVVEILLQIRQDPTYAT